MKNINWNRIGSLACLALAVVALSLAFQNCGKVGDSSTGAQSSTASSVVGTTPLPHGLVTHSATIAAYQSSGQVSEALPLLINEPYDMRLSGDATPTRVTWQVQTGQTGLASCSLIGTSLVERSLSCTGVGLASVQLTADFSDSAPVILTFQRQVVDSATSPSGSLLQVTFDILPGTGSQPWNAPSSPVVVFKGQTLHIINKDSAVHRLHTIGLPCPHQPANMATGESYDCVITAAHDAGAGNMYDHNEGNAAQFYVNAIDGAAEYAQKFNVQGAQKACMDCHGALATSAVRGATLSRIKAQIAANTGGMGAITLTDNQLSAIVFELNK